MTNIEKLVAVLIIAILTGVGFLIYTIIHFIAKFW